MNIHPQPTHSRKSVKYLCYTICKFPSCKIQTNIWGPQLPRPCELTVLEHFGSLSQRLNYWEFHVTQIKRVKLHVNISTSNTRLRGRSIWRLLVIQLAFNYAFMPKQNRADVEKIKPTQVPVQIPHLPF